MASENKKDDVQVTLTMPLEQAMLLVAACELYARIRMGQWNEIVNHCLDLSRKDYCEAKEQIESHLLQARRIVWPELWWAGHTWGIGKFKEADIVWQLYEVLRYEIAINRDPDAGRTGNFCKPISLTGCPLADCKIEQIKKQRKE